MDPLMAVMLAIGASNRAEQVHGFSPYQWVYGKGDGLREAVCEDMSHVHGYEQADVGDVTQLVGKSSEA